jgi:hypothetical protein
MESIDAIWISAYMNLTEESITVIIETNNRLVAKPVTATSVINIKTTERITQLLLFIYMKKMNEIAVNKLVSENYWIPRSTATFQAFATLTFRAWSKTKIQALLLMKKINAIATNKLVSENDSPISLPGNWTIPGTLPCITESDNDIGMRISKETNRNNKKNEKSTDPIQREFTCWDSSLHVARYPSNICLQCSS